MLGIFAVSGAVADTTSYLFKVPVQGLRATTGAQRGDPYWANVTFLGSFDGVSGATVFSDAKGNAITPFGAPVLTSGGPYGQGTSLSLNGTSALQIAPSNGFVFSRDFTIEMWAYVSSHATNAGLMAYATAVCSNAVAGWQLIFDQSSNNLRIESTGGNPLLISTGTVPANTWTHIALVRHGTSANNVTFYIDGNPSGSATDNTTWDGGANQVYIGHERCGTHYTTGNFADVRITNGVARYTGAFTPPTDFPSH